RGRMNLSGRTLFPLSFITLFGYFLYRVHAILLPFALAAVLAYLFNPLVRFFEVRGLRRRPVVFVLYLGLMSICALAFYKPAFIAALEAEQAAGNMPIYVRKGTEMFIHLRGSINSALFDYVAEHGKRWPQYVLSRMPSFALGILPILEFVLLVPFIGFFLIQ